MPKRLGLKFIEFHDGDATYNFRGSSGGYSTNGAPCVTVTFEVNEHDGRFVTLTEVVRGPFRDYNEIVSDAYMSLKTRLGHFGELAENIQVPDFDQDQEQQAG